MTRLRSDEMAQCRRCGAKILWRSHPRTGKKAPIDAVAVEGGNIKLLGDEQYEVVEPSKERLHVNHFMTCKNPPKRS